MKVCRKCHEAKELSEFSRCKSMKDGFHNICKVCDAKRKKEAYIPHPREVNSYKTILENGKRVLIDKEAKRQYDKSYRLMKKFGITPEDYDKMFEMQDGKCAICHKNSGRTLHVDHNHKTGKVRGLLCFQCNLVLGYSYDDTEILRNATLYLQKEV